MHCSSLFWCCKFLQHNNVRRWNVPRLKIFADLRNILDKDYSDIYGYNTAGFNAYGGIRFRF